MIPKVLSLIRPHLQDRVLIVPGEPTVVIDGSLRAEIKHAMAGFLYEIWDQRGELILSGTGERMVSCLQDVCEFMRSYDLRPLRRVA